MKEQTKFKKSLKDCKKKHSYLTCKNCKQNCNGKIHYKAMYNAYRDINKIFK